MLRGGLGLRKTQERDGAGGGIVAISGKKRKSDAMRLGKGTGTRVISSGFKKRMDGDVDEGVEEDGRVLRHAKRPRFEKGEVCVCLSPPFLTPVLAENGVGMGAWKER